MAARRVIVTGGSSGVGAALVKRLATKGYHIFFTGRQVEAMETLQKEALSLGAAGVAFGKGDVSDVADVDRHYEAAVTAMGGVDVLVANAGCGAGRALLEEVGIDNFDKMMNVNVKGVYLWLNKVLPTFREQNAGQIVVTSSVAGVRAVPRASIYAATKWAITGMILSLRKELEGTAIKVGTVNPGPIDTAWWSDKHRGGVREPALVPPRETMLTTDAVVDTMMLLIEQSPSSNIASIVQDPTSS
eukprot:m.23652 g.23652  ORF g.23652 m.23652 type:complete len:245 (-) comp11415_c0_seq4:199-933(-)